MNSKNQAIAEIVGYAQSRATERLRAIASDLGSLSVQEGLIREVVMGVVPRLEETLERRPSWDTSDTLYQHWIARNFTDEMIAHPAIVAISKKIEKYTDNLGTHWRVYREDTAPGDFSAAHATRVAAREAETAVRTPQQQALWDAYWRAFETQSAASMEGERDSAMRELRNAFVDFEASTRVGN